MMAQIQPDHLKNRGSGPAYARTHKHTHTATHRIQD